MTQLLRRIWPCLALLAALVGISKGASAATLPTGFEERLVISGLNDPTTMAFAPDGRLFICEQSGTVRVVKNGAKLPDPFLSLAVATEGERGVLGIAFDPDFAVNHYIYLYYTTRLPEIHNRVSRFTANGDVAVANSEIVLLDLENVTTIIHNGGALRFGPDGKLFIAVGEDGRPPIAQSLDSLLGKMLRINKDGSIPTDNPFYNQTTGKNRAIWALGLRNPFTFDIQRGTGRMFINDVGLYSWEEINDGIAGSNYGWPETEGATNDPRFRGPFLTYPHTFNDTGGCAVTGGAFYNAAQMPFPAKYAGKYFYVDHCVGWVRILDSSTGGSELFANGLDYPVDLKVDAQGALNYLARGANSVYRIVYSPVSTSPVAITSQPLDTVVEVGRNATFSVAVSGQAPFTYQWRRDGADIPGATGATYSFPVAVSDDEAVFSVFVTNPRGTVTSRDAVLAVSLNTAPTPTMFEPTIGARYNAGDNLVFSGDATDAEEGVLPASAFSWKIVFHHGTHTHPFRDNLVGIKSGSVEIPTQYETAADVFYRVTLTVHDIYGSATSVSRDILPRVVQLQLRTNPAGLKVTLDGQPKTVPVNENSVVGVEREIGAPTQTVNGVTYAFSSWSDGGAATHTISTPAANTVYVANFRDVSDSPPLVTIASPANGAALRSLPLVSGTATDDVSVTKVTLRLQRASDSKFWTGTAWGVSTELTTALAGAINSRTWTRNSDLPSGGNLAPGSYTLTATATDGGALTGTATRSFTVPAASAPAVTFTAPAAGAAIASLPAVSGTVTDAIGISDVTFRLQRASDGKLWTGSAWGLATELTTTPAGTLTSGTWSRSADLPAGTDLLAGSYTLTATATNTSAVTATATRSFSVTAATAPTVAFTAPASGASLTSLPAVSGTATDAVLVAAVTFRLQRASDSKFWTGSAWGAETVLTTTLGGTPTSRTWIRTTDLPSGANLLPGSYTLTATATNGSALTGTATRGFTVPVPTAGGSVVATVTTPANNSTIKALPLANGTVVDKTGGTGISKVELTLQRIADLKFWSGTAWVVTSTPLPTGLSGGTWSKTTFPAAGANANTQLLEGKYILTAQATNLTGDVSANTAASKTQFTVDRSVPTDLVIINPVFNGKLKGIPKINGTVKDNFGVASVQLRLQRSSDTKSWNGTSWVTAEALLATSIAGPVNDRVWSLSTGLPSGENLVLGTYALTAIATDFAGNKTTVPWRFVITEGNNPTVTINSPANATTISSMSTINGVAGDTGGSSLASIKLTLRRMSDNAYWSGSQWLPESADLPTQVTTVTAFNFNWVCTVMPKGVNLLNGVYRAQATAFDKAGNKSSIYQTQFTFKQAAAIIARTSGVLLSSATAQGGKNGTIQLIFTGAVSGSATDVANYSVTLGGEPVEVFSAQQKAPGTIVLTAGTLPAGARAAVSYYLQDTGGGNVAGTTNVTVR